MRSLVVVVLAISVLFNQPATAAEVSFEEKYQYDASEADSKLSCRAISLVEIKRLLLERLGTYIETESTVENMQLTRDEVTSFSAGVVRTEILEESWNGKQYSMTARIVVDPEEVARLVNKIKNNPAEQEKVRKLEKINGEAVARISEMKAEMENLQENLVTLNRGHEKSQKIIDAWGAYERGVDLRLEGNYEQALKAFNLAVESNQNYLAYFQRARTLMKLKKYPEAIVDFSKVIKLNPEMKDAFFRRGKSYRKIGEKRKGLEDIREAARQGSKLARQFLKDKGKSY
jgi:tetratricopeptide (TPR) repeat protein